MRVVFDHHTILRTHISIKSSSLIVRLSKEPPLNALQAVMLRPYHPFVLSTMLSTKAPFLFADSPIIDGSLTGETHLVKLVVTMNCVQSF